MEHENLSKKALLVTGGTGSFGNAVVNRYLNKEEFEKIIIYSRDELKQDDMRKLHNNKKLHFVIGDVRDFSAINQVMINVDYVFHAAALKQVPACELNPMEAYKTNVLGTDNVLTAAIANGVKKVICLSTDKAVYPINAMGISKAMLEKIVFGKSIQNSNTTICCTRYGNVLYSRGSVVPLFIHLLKSGKPLTITSPKMTRFLMSLEDAVDLVEYAFINGEKGDLFVKKSPACKIMNLAKALSIMFKTPMEINYIGSRLGEKTFEVLCSLEEMSKAVDLGEYYKVKMDIRSLYYDSSKTVQSEKSRAYTSNNTKLLKVPEIIKLLLTIKEVQHECFNHLKT